MSKYLDSTGLLYLWSKVKGVACGKRVSRFTVGTSAAGWTAKDCDYLCDGTDDQVEINAAIQALPATGGEVVILDGTYNIAEPIAVNKANTKLSGNGAATVLKRALSGFSANGIINVEADICTIADLTTHGNYRSFGQSTNHGIYIRGCIHTTVTGNVCSNNGGGGIYGTGVGLTIARNTCTLNGIHGIFADGDNSTVTGNVCSNNGRYGIFADGDNSTVTGNACNSNGYYGIALSSKNTTVTGNVCNNCNYGGIYIGSVFNSTVTGNTFVRGTGLSSDYAASQHTIYLYGSNNKYNLIADNNIMGKDYVAEGGTGNTFVNNKYN